MKIAISGYGKMGKEVEKIALFRSHEIVCIINNAEELPSILNSEAEVVIDFTSPESALQNMEYFLENNIPVVIGTTGWHKELKRMEEKVTQLDGALFYASNFSIGVQLYFEANRHLAQLMNQNKGYVPFIIETHHTEKKDAPSGTAISTAEVILSELDYLNNWVIADEQADGYLGIESIREEDVKGKHTVTYTSSFDQISLTHNAFSRQGFADGAVKAAEYLVGKKGIFGMKDLLGFGI